MDVQWTVKPTKKGQKVEVRIFLEPPGVSLPCQDACLPCSGLLCSSGHVVATRAESDDWWCAVLQGGTGNQLDVQGGGDVEITVRDSRMFFFLPCCIRKSLLLGRDMLRALPGICCAWRFWHFLVEPLETLWCLISSGLLVPPIQQ